MKTLVTIVIALALVVQPVFAAQVDLDSAADHHCEMDEPMPCCDDADECGAECADMSCAPSSSVWSFAAPLHSTRPSVSRWLFDYAATGPPSGRIERLLRPPIA